MLTVMFFNIKKRKVLIIKSFTQPLLTFWVTNECDGTTVTNIYTSINNVLTDNISYEENYDFKRRPWCSVKQHEMPSQHT